jgi:hypothetical protein
MNDRDILRALAGKLRSQAARPVMAERAALWAKLNNLQPCRPLLYVIPEGAWVEILPDGALQCADSFHRQLERQLRQRLWLAENVDDDAPVEPWLNLNWRIEPGDYGVEIPMHHGDDRGSYVWEAPLADLDLRKVHYRRPAVDRAATERDVARATELFGDLLPVRLRGGLWWTCGLTWTAIKLVGLENLMLLMFDQPEGLHRLMAWLRDEQLNYITWAEREGLLTRNDGPSSGVGSGGIGYLGGESPNGPCRLSDLWGLAESQETVGVSPEMFAEFILPYQAPLMAKFRYTYYGCCEPMDKGVDLVAAAMPNLRAVSVAPMANLEIMAAKLAGKYVFYRKPNPAHVCVGFNEPAIRDDLRRTLRAAGHRSLALVLKDTHTVEHDPTRLPRWAQIAREEIAAHAA